MGHIPAKFECGNCKTISKVNELLCEDWKDESKSMVCPNCRYYLTVPENPRIKVAVVIASISVTVGLIFSFYTDNPRALTGFVFFFVIPAIFYANPKPFEPRKTNAHGKSKI